MITQNQRSVLFSILFTAVLLHLQPIPAVVSADPIPYQRNGTDYIRTSCDATLYPEVCYASLSRYARGVQQDPARLARVAICISLSKARNMAAYLSNLSRQADYQAEHPASAALHECSSMFEDAVDEIRGSLKQMRQLGDGRSSAESFQFQISNVQTWMSAALTDGDTCTDGLEDVADGLLKMEVCDRVAEVKKFTSNALAFVNSYAAKGMP